MSKKSVFTLFLTNTDMNLYIGDNTNVHWTNTEQNDIEIRGLQYYKKDEIIENWGPTYSITFNVTG